jgi:hypothetical protein
MATNSTLPKAGNRLLLLLLLFLLFLPLTAPYETAKTAKQQQQLAQTEFFRASTEQFPTSHDSTASPCTGQPKH